MKIKTNELKQLIAEAVKESLSTTPLNEKKKLDPVGRTEEGEYVGVGQIRDIDNDGDIDSSDAYLAHRRKKITQNIRKEDLYEQEDDDKPYDRHEHGYRKSTTWGEVPDADELWNLMDGEAYDMVLQGADSLAFEYAMDLSPDPRAGSLAAGEGMHATLMALVDAQEPEDLSDEEYEDVEKTLDRWHARYGDMSIAEQAWSLASSIMETLGVEWI